MLIAKLAPVEKTIDKETAGVGEGLDELLEFARNQGILNKPELVAAKRIKNVALKLVLGNIETGEDNLSHKVVFKDDIHEEKKRGGTFDNSGTTIIVVRASINGNETIFGALVGSKDVARVDNDTFHTAEITKVEKVCDGKVVKIWERNAKGTALTLLAATSELQPGSGVETPTRESKAALQLNEGSTILQISPR